MLKRCGIGVGAGCAVTAVLLAVLSFVGTGMDDPRALSGVFGLVAFFGGVLSCALVGGLAGEGACVPAALICAGIYCALNLALSLAFGQAGERAAYQPIIMCGVALALSACVGLICERRRGGSRNVRKRLKKMAGR